MQEISLRQFKRGVGSELWKLQIDDTKWRLMDPAGTVVADFSSEEAARRIVLPSFFSLVPGGALQVHVVPPVFSLWAGLSPNRFRLFHPEPEAIATIRAHFDSRLAQQDVITVRKQRSRGQLKTLVGGLASAGVILYWIVVIAAIVHGDPVQGMVVPGGVTLAAAAWLWASGRRDAKQADRALAAIEESAQERHDSGSRQSL